MTESGTEESTQPPRWSTSRSSLQSSRNWEVSRFHFPPSRAFLGPDAVSTASSLPPLLPRWVSGRKLGPTRDCGESAGKGSGNAGG